MPDFSDCPGKRGGKGLGLALLLIAAVGGCAEVGGGSSSASGTSGASPTPGGTGSGTPTPGAGAGGSGASTTDGAARPTDTGSIVVSQPQPGAVQAGRLTAGTWDDNLNFDFYLSYLQKIADAQLADVPLIPRANRLQVQVTDPAGAPLGNATVTVSGASGTLLEAPTRPDGKLFFFPGDGAALPVGSDLQVGVKVNAGAGASAATASAVATVGDATVTVVIPGVTAAPAATLDLALVIDTTGSMGDELDYLKTEVSAIAGQVARDFPGVTQRLALILYRDDGDTYVVRSFDFTGSLATFQAQIAAQSADGGGDTPEAPDQALARLPALSWGPDTIARMAFWIADAPHHTGHGPAMASGILAAQRRGIRLYPIAASGTDDLLEYSMRTAAEVTGGRYLFLTDDSGIGNSHQEPTIPCYVVTTLEKAMFRMISMELLGGDLAVPPADVIRTTGSPDDHGRCTLADGSEVSQL